MKDTLVMFFYQSECIYRTIMIQR